jgi:hypothetical protein
MTWNLPDPLGRLMPVNMYYEYCVSGDPSSVGQQYPCLALQIAADPLAPRPGYLSSLFLFLYSFMCLV